jgi:peptidoglycan/xylan/chitin deacetylase (PgdA/CDA1 family)
MDETAPTRPWVAADELYPWSPITARPALRWPGGRPVAFAVIVLLEYAGPGASTAPIRPAGASSLRMAPNLLFRSHREYGHRVGVFRLLDALAEFGVPACIAIDAQTAQRYPFVVECCRDQGAEFVAHGIAVDQPITARMTRQEESDYIRLTRDTLRDATGSQPSGWFGAEQSGSPITALLLDELDFGYVCDWPNDEQPYRMHTPRGLVALPTAHSLDDVVCVWGRATAPSHYTRSVAAACEVMAHDGAGSGRVLVLVVRPWLSGRPHQIDAFRAALREVRDSGSAWLAGAGQIAAVARGQILGAADRH